MGVSGSYSEDFQYPTDIKMDTLSEYSILSGNSKYSKEKPQTLIMTPFFAEAELNIAQKNFLLKILKSAVLSLHLLRAN